MHREPPDHTRYTHTVYAHQVNKSSWCSDRYSNCELDSSGTKCKYGYGSISDGNHGYDDKYRDGVCYKDHPDHVTKRLMPPSPRAAPWPSSHSLPRSVRTPQPRCPRTPQTYGAHLLQRTAVAPKATGTIATTFTVTSKRPSQCALYPIPPSHTQHSLHPLLNLYARSDRTPLGPSYKPHTRNYKPTQRATTQTTIPHLPARGTQARTHNICVSLI